MSASGTRSYSEPGAERALDMGNGVFVPTEDGSPTSTPPAGRVTPTSCSPNSGRDRCGVDLPAGAFDVVFSATAWHWIDPAVGYALAAHLLAGGALALATNAHVAGGTQAEIATEVADLHARLCPEIGSWQFPTADTVAERALGGGTIAEVWARIDRSFETPPPVQALFEEPAVSTFKWTTWPSSGCRPAADSEAGVEGVTARRPDVGGNGLKAYALAMTDVRDRYRQVAGGFDAAVRAVTPDKWEAQSPCEQWRARDVVAHVVAGHRSLIAGVGGGEPKPLGADEDPRRAWEEASRAIDEITGDPEA
ncbi:MAG: maleylpyruvate isomerase N-terminal domain-containing protein, partial [Acidimicrobiales bacterium]